MLSKHYMVEQKHSTPVFTPEQLTMTFARFGVPSHDEKVARMKPVVSTMRKLSEN
jgi:hypothetical protein